MVLNVAPFLITAQPQSQATFLGATVRLSVAVSGQGPIYYQWRLNGTNILDATNSKFVLTNLRIEHSGSYSVLVSNPVGSAMSDTVFLSVGEVIAWGYNGLIATNLPFGLTNITAIAAGDFHSLALRADGTVIAWGERAGTNVPTGLTNVVAVAAGATHSLAVKSDTTVVAWGTNDIGQFRVPFGLSNVVAVAAGGGHSLVLKADHTVQSWGYYYYGNPLVPYDLTNAIAIAAGDSHSVALRADGTVTVWGDDGWGESIVPSGLSNVIAIAAGGQYTAALKVDGTVVVWGASYAGQTNIPLGLNNVIAISAREQHTIAMKADKSLVTWGNDRLATPPPDVRNVRAFSAGGYDLAMLGNAPLILDQPISLIITEGSNAVFGVSATGVPSPSYQWRHNGVDISGATASVLSLTGIQPNAGGLYSVIVSNAYGVLTSSNALLRINHPPVADASATLLEVLSSNKINAMVVLDGSRSSDEDGDPLQFLWSDTSSAKPLATGIVTVVTLPLGTNPITLSVSDGLAWVQQTIVVRVLSTDQALAHLIDLINLDALKPDPLVATLSAALASINRGSLTAAVEQLGAFRDKVEAQVAPVDPSLAGRLVRISQSIAQILGGAAAPVTLMTIYRHSNGRIRVRFSTRPVRTCIIEASTNLVDWQAVGSAPGGYGGGFEFEDPNSGGFPSRYYRVVEP